MQPAVAATDRGRISALLTSRAMACRLRHGRRRVERLFERAGAGRHTAASAGTSPAEHVHPEVVPVVRELGIDPADRRPSASPPSSPSPADVVVTMGCGDERRYLPGKRYRGCPRSRRTLNGGPPASSARVGSVPGANQVREDRRNRHEEGTRAEGRHDPGGDRESAASADPGGARRARRGGEGGAARAQRRRRARRRARADGARGRRGRGPEGQARPRPGRRSVTATRTGR